MASLSNSRMRAWLEIPAAIPIAGMWLD